MSIAEYLEKLKAEQQDSITLLARLSDNLDKNINYNWNYSRYYYFLGKEGVLSRAITELENILAEEGRQEC